jgi:hypothetical protein
MSTERAGGVAPVLEHLLSKHKSLNSNQYHPKINKQKTKQKNPVK